MRSTDGAALSLACQAIEDIARHSLPGRGTPAHKRCCQGAHGRGGYADDDITVRIAAAWALVAEADPGLARRLPGYLSAGEETGSAQL